MSKAFLQEIASQTFDGLVASGVGDVGTYTAPGGSPVPCRVVIGRGIAPFGTFGTVPGNKTTLRLLLEEIPSPVRDAVIAADGETFTLVKEISNEHAALSTWEVL